MKGLGVFILGMFLIGFALAAVNPPVNLVFKNNASGLYDEGSFNLNWTSGAGDPEIAYTVFVFANNILFGSFANTSLVGYSFNNFTEANYTFIVQSENSTGDLSNSTSVYMYVDNTAPVITLPEYINGTLSKNSDFLTLNVSVIDALSGLIGSSCIVNINGINQNFIVNNGWCNSSSLNLSGLNDGNQTINIYVNDSINNAISSSSYVVWMDSTNPVAIASCDSSSVVLGSSLSCTCTGNDGSGSGINSSLTTPAANPSTLISGTFIYSCSLTDNIGNIGISNFSYVVTIPIRSSGGGYPTYHPTFLKLSQGYNIILGENFKVKFEFLGDEHLLIVNNITDEKVKITVESTPIIFEIGLLENKRIDLDNDGYYDLNIFLKNFIYSRPNFVLTLIKEVVDENKETVEKIVEKKIETKEDITGEIIEKESEFNNGYLRWIVGLILILILILILKKMSLINFNVIELKNKLLRKSKEHKSFRVN